MIRGIGDPLIATYTRCYLCRVGATVSLNSDYIKETLNDFLFIYHTVRMSFSITSMQHHWQVFTHFSDTIGWHTHWTSIQKNRRIWLFIIFQSCTRLDHVFSRSESNWLRIRWSSRQMLWKKEQVISTLTVIAFFNFIKKKFFSFSGLLFQSILTSFRSTYIASRALKFVQILSMSSEEDSSRAQLFRLFGQSLCKCQPPDDQLMPVLSGSLKIINSLTKPSEFIQCIEPWTEYASIHFNVIEFHFSFRLNDQRASLN